MIDRPAAQPAGAIRLREKASHFEAGLTGKREQP